MDLITMNGVRLSIFLILFCYERILSEKRDPEIQQRAHKLELWRVSKMFPSFIFCYLSFAKLKLTIPFCVLSIKLVHNVTM